MVMIDGSHISGTSIYTISGNTVSFTGSQTHAAGVPIIQLILTVATSLFTLYLDDNVLDVSGLSLTGTTIDPATVYRDRSPYPLYIHAIIGNLINNIEAANYPTIYCRRNIVRSFQTTAWPRMLPNLLRINNQLATMNPITVSDNQIVFDGTSSQVPDLVAYIVLFDPQTFGGTVTVSNNHVSISNLKGLTHTVTSNTIYTNGALTINGAMIVRNNSITIQNISSAAATTPILQFLTSTMGGVSATPTC